jgi:hypothetical protein
MVAAEMPAAAARGPAYNTAMATKKPTFRAVKAAYRRHMRAMAELGQLIEHASALRALGASLKPSASSSG